jgi:formate--tetrahydrofolate ligase
MSDLDIARAARLRPMADVAADLGLSPDDLRPYGRDKAKIELHAAANAPMDGKLILVSAMSPTPAGEGKTTVTVGLGQAFGRIGARAAIALREPSLGPVMGLKGGAAGGGQAQVVPMESINLHFTGDLHAITCAHNVLASLVDNALHFREGSLDPRKTTWKRVLDVNDRSLRHVIVGLDGDGVPRQTGFDITAASEVMAVFCLACDRADLRARLARIVVGETYDGRAGHRRRSGGRRPHGRAAGRGAGAQPGADPGRHTRPGARGALRQHRPRHQQPHRHPHGVAPGRLCHHRGRLRLRSGGGEVLRHRVSRR